MTQNTDNDALSVQGLQGYDKIDSFSFKKGRYAVWANIISGILLIGTIVLCFVFFPIPLKQIGSETIIWLAKAVAAIFLAVLCMFINFGVKAAVLKSCDCGKVKLHVGLIIEVYAEKPAKNRDYLKSDLISLIITVIIPGVILCFFWDIVVFFPFAFSLINAVCYVPALMFLLRQPKDAYIKLEQGNLLSLRKID